MARAKQRKIYCPLCPAWYPIAEIRATSKPGGESRPWHEVMLSDKQLKSKADRVAEAWKPECPEKHPLPESLDEPLVVGVIGYQNSSKSHYLAGMVYELLSRQSLRNLGLDVSYVADTGDKMDSRIDSVYSKREILQNTQRGHVDGPFTYRITLRNSHSRSSSSDRSQLLMFFDVAGEDCTSLRSTASFVRYIFEAKGLILLVDPDGLPVLDRPLQPRGAARLTNRAIIDTLAEVIIGVTGADPRDRDQLLVIALSKADKAELPASIYPSPELIFSSTRKTRRALGHYSEICRQEIVARGGQAVVDAAVNRFGQDKVMFAAVSATNESPQDGQWVDPAPIGCVIPIAQVLLKSRQFLT